MKPRFSRFVYGIIRNESTIELENVRVTVVQQTSLIPYSVDHTVCHNIFLRAALQHLLGTTCAYTCELIGH